VLIAILILKQRIATNVMLGQISQVATWCSYHNMMQHATGRVMWTREVYWCNL